jgi:hypothetical protein
MANQYLPTYIPPAGTMRKFDLRANHNMSVNNDGTLPNLERHSPRICKYLDEVEVGNTNVAYITADGQRGIGLLTAGQRSTAYAMGLALVWEAAHAAATQNDAYGRWVRDRHGLVHLTTVPDELMLRIGGIHSRTYVEPYCALWVLCYLERQDKIKVEHGLENVVELLKSESNLASYLLKLRAGVEMSDQLMRISNCRITGCLDPFLVDASVDNRMVRGHKELDLSIAPAKYLARQALTMATIFDHTDAALVRTGGVKAVGTFRLREPSSGGAFPPGEMRHMNWISPQQLNCQVWRAYFGVAEPSFMLDREGRALLSEARWTSSWQDVHPDFKAFGLMDREDEIWTALLTSHFSDVWVPATMSVVGYGDNLLVDIADIRDRHCTTLAHIMMRMNLPYESRLAGINIKGVPGANVTRRPYIGAPPYEMADADGLCQLDVVYSANGVLTTCTARAVDGDDWRYMRFRDHAWGESGIRLQPVNQHATLQGAVNMERQVAEFWMAQCPTNPDLSAGMSGALSRLLTSLTVPPVPEEEDQGKGIGKGTIQDDANAANVDKQKDVGQPGVGNMPMREVGGSDAASLVSAISSLSVGDRALIFAAMAKELGVAPDDISGGTEANTLPSDTNAGANDSGDSNRSS